MKTIAFAMMALVLGLAAPAQAAPRKHPTTAAHAKQGGTHAASHHKATSDHARRTPSAKKRTAHAAKPAHAAKSGHTAKSAKSAKKHAAH